MFLIYIPLVYLSFYLKLKFKIIDKSFILKISNSLFHKFISNLFISIFV